MPRLRLSWQRGTVLHPCRTCIPRRTSCGVLGCIRSGASPEFRRSKALQNRWLGTRNLHEAHVRRNVTKHQHRRRDGLDGSDRDVLPNGRWKGTSKFDAFRDKVVRLRKIKGIEKRPTWEPKTSTDRHISACCRDCTSSQPCAGGSWTRSRQQAAERRRWTVTRESSGRFQHRQ